MNNSSCHFGVNIIDNKLEKTDLDQLSAHLQLVQGKYDPQLGPFIIERHIRVRFISYYKEPVHESAWGR